METPSSKPDWRFQIETRFVRESSLSIEARLLYIIIKSYAGPNCVNPFPSLWALSRSMGRHRASIQKYLKELEVSGWVERIKIKESGKFTSTRYVLNSSPSNVAIPSKLRSHDSSLRDSSLRMPPTTGVLPSKSNQFKDLPSGERKTKETKETPPRGSVDFSIPPEIPESLKAALIKWQSHRREIKKPITATAWAALIADCLKWPTTMEDAINKSILSGWQGLFPDPPKSNESEPAKPKPKKLPANWREIGQLRYGRDFSGVEIEQLTYDEFGDIQRDCRYYAANPDQLAADIAQAEQLEEG
jgi:hypothetical protein